MLSDRARDKIVRMTHKGFSALEIHRACCECFPAESPSLVDVGWIVRSEIRRKQLQRRGVAC